MANGAVHGADERAVSLNGQTVRMRARLVALLAVVCSACFSEAAKPPLAAPPVFARIELRANSVPTGGEIEGRVVVVNNTGAPIHDMGCGSPFQVALTSEDFEPRLVWPACSGPITIPSGESSFPVTVVAQDLACQEGPVPQDCGPHPLSPGTYEATLYQAPEVVPDPKPVIVDVTSSEVP